MKPVQLLRNIQSKIENKIGTIDHNESVLQQPRSWASSITWGLIATTGLSISWLAFAKTEEIVVATGTLVPIGAVQDIQMPIGGIVEDIFVKDGDKVMANQTLIKLDTEATAQQYKSIEENLRLKQIQLELKRVELERYKNVNNNAINNLELKVSSEKEILNRYIKLEEFGASAELLTIQQRNTVQDAEGRLSEVKLDGLRQIAIIEQDLQRLKSEVSSIRSELAKVKVTLRYQSLRAPVSGVVFDLQPKGRGFTGRGSETLMKIVPLNALEAKVEIPSSDIGFVQDGMEVDLSIDSFPATDFGVLLGHVEHIGSDALPPDPAKQEYEYRYPAKIRLEEQFLALKSGENLTLQPGMSLTANIKLRKVSYLQLLLGSFKEKAESLREL